MRRNRECFLRGERRIERKKEEFFEREKEEEKPAPLIDTGL